MSSNLIEGTNIYVIMGPGRTGSNFLLERLSHPLDDYRSNSPGGVCNAWGISDEKKGNVDLLLLYCEQNNVNAVIHTHNQDFIKHFQIDPRDVTLIVSKRRDEFETAMSHLTARVTGQWHKYSSKIPSPVNVDIDQFKTLISTSRLWYRNVDLTQPYRSIHTIYYEDVVSGGHAYLIKELGVSSSNVSPSLYTFSKCPHRYQDWIENWRELKEVFDNIADVAQ